jgi:hypothetical protein
VPVLQDEGLKNNFGILLNDYEEIAKLKGFDSKRTSQLFQAKSIDNFLTILSPKRMIR